VGDIDGAPIRQFGSDFWSAAVTVTVHITYHQPVAGAVVAGQWTYEGVTKQGSCSTDANGQCTISGPSDEFKVHSASAVTFLVTDVSYWAPYWSSENHDEDGDSAVQPDPTYIVIQPPPAVQATTAPPSPAAARSSGWRPWEGSYGDWSKDTGCSTALESHDSTHQPLVGEAEAFDKTGSRAYPAWSRGLLGGI
jgi:hypothetical protein